MAYTITTHRLGLPAVGVVSDSSSPAVQPGTIVQGFDPVYGGGEFIYLPCLSAQIVGSLVVYAVGSGTSSVTLAPNTANQGRPAAVSMVANSTGTAKYSWFAIQGTVPIKKTAIKVSPSSSVFLSGTAGRVQATAGTGKQVLGTRTMNSATVASATSTVLVEINRPFLQGQII